MVFEALTPVWGERYVDRLVDVVVPSWLARGNLPALASRAPVRVNFLTSSHDAERLRRAPIVQQLARHADVACTPIDDLIAPGSYSVPLTLAFHRGLSGAYVPGRTAQCFLLNADFVLSDGSLRAAADALARGARLVQATSLRVVEERVLRQLHQRVNEQGALQEDPRTLMEMAFESLHPTVLAARCDQAQFSSSITNQFFWRADANTLIARPFLLFALALTVDAPPPQARSYVDYGLPWAVVGPEAATHVMTDSDAFLALELGPEAQEAQFIRYGAPTPETAAADMSTWATAYHRAQAQHVLYFRKGPASKTVAQIRAQSDAFIAQLLTRLGPDQALFDHPNWVSDVREWRMARLQVGRCDIPPELGEGPGGDTAPRLVSAGERPRSLRIAARELLVGKFGAIRRFWQPFYALDAVLHGHLRGRRVEVFGAPGLLNHVVSPPPVGDPGAPVQYLVGLDPSGTVQTRYVLEQVRAAAGDRTDLIVLAVRRDGEALDNGHLLRLCTLLDPWADIVDVAGFDLTTDVAVERIYGRLADRLAVETDVRRRLQLVVDTGAAFARIVTRNAGRRFLRLKEKPNAWIVHARTRSVSLAKPTKRKDRRRKAQKSSGR